jgi:hypothetical protein
MLLRARRQVFSLPLAVRYGRRSRCRQSDQRESLAARRLALVHFLANNLILAALVKIKGHIRADDFRRNARTCVVRLASLPAAGCMPPVPGRVVFMVCVCISWWLSLVSLSGTSALSGLRGVSAVDSLSAISGVMRASLDLPNLEAIHEHIGQLLDAWLLFCPVRSDTVRFLRLLFRGEVISGAPCQRQHGRHDPHAPPLLVRENRETSEQLGDPAGPARLGWGSIPDGRALPSLPHSLITVPTITAMELLTTVAQVAVAINAQLYTHCQRAEMAILDQLHRHYRNA